VNRSEWKVLAVDDEADNLSLISDILSFSDVTVVPAESGQQAIDLLDGRPYTMALVDLQMPQITGWDVIKHVRESGKPELRQMLVIAITAYAMRGDRERVLEAGFDGYISKPIDVDKFMQTLQTIVDEYQTRTGLSITAGKPSEES
jgi:CheY-like chemotaxis protein